MNIVNYLLSFPRSGNTWVRYCVEFLSEKPTDFINAKDGKHMQSLYLKCKNLDVDKNSDLILIKAHQIDDSIIGNKSKENRLILLVRNPFEVITRGGPDRYKNSLSIRTCKYMSCINTYEKWGNNKIIIYYEDLILYPEITLDKILNFIDVDNYKLKDFIKNYKYHKQQSIIYYTNNVETPYTKGYKNKVKFHSLRASEEDINIVKNVLYKQYNELSKKYLFRYIDNL